MLNSAVHKWNSYAPLAFKAGISKEGLEMVLEYPVIGKGKGGDKNKEGGGLGEREWVVLACTD